MSLNQNAFALIMQEYDERQRRIREEVKRKKEFVYEKNPRIREIERKIATVSVSCTARAIGGDEEAGKERSRLISQLKQEKESIYREMGLSPDFFEPRYECPKCRDTGYVDGKKCQCLKQAIINYVYDQSNLKDAIEGEGFKGFSLKYYDKEFIDPLNGNTPYEQARIAYEASLDFVNTFNREFKNLLFLGNTGVGKTFLSSCIAKEVIKKGFSVMYFSAISLFEVWAKGQFEKNEDARAQQDEIIGTDLLIIDDLGTEVANSFTHSSLFHCINERMIMKRPVIISSNLTLEELTGVYTERIISRIFQNYSIIWMSGNDIRMEKRLEKF